ncbi:hypothetical protein [Sphingobium yanoikuyae]|jgi:hypothetical protein|uniref:hypothetical protein n=1 Tax=Sphingobium yanoikuyae TaxID=13690 RepID=UPI0028A5F185|nr:hypothetical protein [Sphingobium yanoikuyae]
MKIKLTSVIDKVATVVAKNKAVAAAAVSLFAIMGVVSQEDTSTWTNVVTAIATVVSQVL